MGMAHKLLYSNEIYYDIKSYVRFLKVIFPL